MKKKKPAKRLKPEIGLIELLRQLRVAAVHVEAAAAIVIRALKNIDK